MMDNKNIPDADQFWPGAEKLLDNHYKRRRILTWLFALIIPSIVAGLSFLYFNHSSKNVENVLSSAANNEITLNTNNSKAEKPEFYSANNSVDAKSLSIQEKLNSNHSKNLSVNEKANTSKSSSLTDSKNNTSNNQFNKAGNTEKRSRNVAKKNAVIVSTAAVYSKQKNSSVVSAVSPNLSSTLNVNLESPSYFNANKNNEKIYAMVPLKENLGIAIPERDVTENSWPKPVGKSCKSSIGLMVSIYGTAQYVSKTLASSNDWGNYIQQREDGEEPIVTPGIGMSVSASCHALSISVGIEYAQYGEKTNYAPYSIQKQIIDNGYWQTYLTNVIDTDTAYVTGNQYVLHTSRSEIDSSYNSDFDTLKESAYDKKIAESNGVNKFYYIEVPIEVSYVLAKGRAGVGISAGIAPGWMVNKKGNYIKSDGSGIESFDEIKSFNTFMMNGRIGLDIYYRLSGRTKLMLRPQYKANLNSVFNDDYGIKQKYNSAGVLFGISYMLN